MKKHKIFLYPLEENGKVKVFLFQSGDIGADRGSCGSFRIPNNPMSISSAANPAMNFMNVIYVNGNSIRKDFRIPDYRFANEYTKEEFDKLKELEYAYNNR